MNHSLSINNYQKDDINNKLNNENPHTIIEEVLVELKKNLNILISCFQNKDSISEAKSKSYSKSLTAIYILQSSLDFDKGGEIARNLNELYDYCRTNIIKSFTNKNIDLLNKVLDIVQEILEGWSSIKNK